MRRYGLPVRICSILAVSVGLSISALGAGAAAAAEAPVRLGTTDYFAVLAGSAVTNTGKSELVGFDLGVSPGTSVTGFPPGKVDFPGVKHVKDAAAAQAQRDATTAFNDAAGRSPSASGLTDLVGQTLQPGVYQGDALSLSGTVTLDNNDVPDAVFIFQASSTLITSSSSVVTFTNADHPSCNVFWEVGSSATLGTGSSFVGTVLAKASITAATSATIQGRLLASTGAVTLQGNRITRLRCAPPTTPSTTSSAPTVTPPTVTPPTVTPPTVTPPPVTPPPVTPPPVTPPPGSGSGVVPPPVVTTPPPRDVTSGRTVPVSLPGAVITTPSLQTSLISTAVGATASTTTSPTTSPTGSMSSTFSTFSTFSSEVSTRSVTPALALDTGSGTTTTGLAVTGPPVLPMLLAALVLLAAGWTLIVFGRTQRRRIGQHRA